MPKMRKPYSKPKLTRYAREPEERAPGPCACCGLYWIECFCPCHTGECDSQWKDDSD